jgi:hypothetical protein
VLFTHKLFSVAATRQSAANIISISGGLPTCRYDFRATKKPRLMARGGDKTVVLLLIFPKPMMPGLELAPVIET